MGAGREIFWRSILEGKPRLGRVTRFDTSSYACQIGGEVDRDCYEHLLDPRKLRSTAHATQLALAAAQLALQDGKLPIGAYAPDAFGVVVGTALGGWEDAEQQIGVLIERGARRVNPFIVSGAGNHGPGIEVAAALGARGAQVTFSSGCPSGLQAIGYGASLVASGVLDACLAGGTETPLNPLTFAALGRTQELCTSNSDPLRASRPFDRSHSGVVLSEGSCFLLLEAADAAEHRSARQYSQVSQMAASCDANGLYGFDPSGEAGARAIHRLLCSNQLDASEIDYVCAHANSSPTFDRKETFVLKRAFGEFAARLPVSSIKGVLGHPFGASGAFQTAAAALARYYGMIPPTHNLEEPDPECDLDHVPGTARSAHIRNVLVTSYGYGGVNTYLLLSSPLA